MSNNHEPEIQGKGLHYFFVNSSDLPLSAVVLNPDGSEAMRQSTIHNTPAGFCDGICHIAICLDPFDANGSLTLELNNAQVLTADINGLTGANDGVLRNMMKTPSVIADNYNLSYGFYNAPINLLETGLTNHDQFYAYVTPPQQNWMGNFIAQNPTLNKTPFSAFVLPGAHDSGTFDLTAVNTLLNDLEYVTFRAHLISVFGDALVDVLADVVLAVITGEAVTQKDNITTQLNLGCRYFDFRPGMMPSPLNLILPDIYHIHSVVPGYPFNSFLTDILTWLKANPTEIVVVNLQTAGFADCMGIPTSCQLQGVLASVQTNTGTESIQVGSIGDLSTSYGQLISDNKRLFFLNTADEFSGWYDAVKYDSYSEAYNTTNPVVIVNALSEMNVLGQVSNNYTVLQLQGTATGQNVANIVFSLIASAENKACEPLLSTKALFDSQTYPWLLQNVQDNLSNNQLVVLLNDFVDNALTDVAASLTKARAAALSAK